MLKVWLNDKIVCLTKLSKTQRNIGLLCIVLKSDELSLVNILNANKVVTQCSADLLHYVC